MPWIGRSAGRCPWRCGYGLLAGRVGGGAVQGVVAAGTQAGVRGEPGSHVGSSEQGVSGWGSLAHDDPHAGRPSFEVEDAVASTTGSRTVPLRFRGGFPPPGDRGPPGCRPQAHLLRQPHLSAASTLGHQALARPRLAPGSCSTRGTACDHGGVRPRIPGTRWRPPERLGRERRTPGLVSSAREFLLTVRQIAKRSSPSPTTPHRRIGCMTDPGLWWTCSRAWLMVAVRLLTRDRPRSSDRAGHGRIGGHRPIQGRFGAHRRDITHLPYHPSVIARTTDRL